MLKWVQEVMDNTRPDKEIEEIKNCYKNQNSLSADANLKIKKFKNPIDKLIQLIRKFNKIMK